MRKALFCAYVISWAIGINTGDSSVEESKEEDNRRKYVLNKDTPVCSKDGDCDENQTCREKLCVFRNVDICIVNEDCPVTGQVCRSGICAKLVPRVECRRRKDCFRPGERCVKKECRSLVSRNLRSLKETSRNTTRSEEKCYMDEDCLDGRVCLKGSCGVQMKGKCRFNEDCEGKERCIKGSCVFPPPSKTSLRAETSHKRRKKSGFEKRLIKSLLSFPFSRVIGNMIRSQVYPILISQFSRFISQVDLEKILKIKPLIKEIKEVALSALKSSDKKKNPRLKSRYTVF